MQTTVCLITCIPLPLACRHSTCICLQQACSSNFASALPSFLPETAQTKKQCKSVRTQLMSHCLPQNESTNQQQSFTCLVIKIQFKSGSKPTSLKKDAVPNRATPATISRIQNCCPVQQIKGSTKTTNRQDQKRQNEALTSHKLRSKVYFI